MLEKILNRNLLKYSAGRAIFCPKCNKVADYRHWVVWTSPLGATGAHCDDCWRDALALVHDDKPHSYLLSIGWDVTTLVDFEKPAKKPRIKSEDIPQKPGKMLDRWLRKTIDAAHAREDKANNCHGHPRLFPKGFGDANWPMVETTSDDGTVTVDYQGDPVFSKLQIDTYIAQFCKLNHLTGA